MKLEPRQTCRICNSNQLSVIMSLGEQHLAVYTPKGSDPEPVLEKFPLELIRCNTSDCGLVQLRHSTPTDILYERYFYRSGINQTMTDNLKEIVDQAILKVDVAENDIVLDIGCNDGTLLRSYQSKVRLVGFEPASNLVNEASKDTDLIINNFFSFFEFVQHFPNERIKAITSIAMFYDLEDPNSFVSDIVNCLDQDGIWVIQMAYLIPMLELNAFDNIVHEHLEYWSLKSVKRLLEEYGLEIFDVELNDVYGGSFRIFVKTKKNGKINIQNSVDEFLKKEDEFGLEKKETYLDFANRVNSLKNKLNDFIKEEISNGKLIYAYGASTKGNTLLQFYNLNNKLISKAADRDSKKFGKMTIGSNIPIISEEQARDEKPDYFLVLPWHLVDFFKERENAFLKNGGKFIVPLPDFKIIS